MEIKLKAVIARHLKSRGLTLNSLAKEVGIGSSTLHNWVQSAQPGVGSLEKLLKLANYLDISLTELLLDKPDHATEQDILFQSVFRDNDHNYKLTIEKIPTKKSK